MNSHGRLLISNNRGQVSVSALERSQFCTAFSRTYHAMSLVSYKVGGGRRKSVVESFRLDSLKKNRQREKWRGKRFIVATRIFLLRLELGQVSDELMDGN